MSGNTVRKLAAAPQRRYEEYEIPKEVEITEEDRIAIRKKRKAIHRANRLNFLYTVGVSAIVITIFAAVNELGMVYPERDQVITYDAGVSEYVKQYHDIP